MKKYQPTDAQSRVMSEQAKHTQLQLGKLLLNSEKTEVKENQPESKGE